MLNRGEILAMHIRGYSAMIALNPSGRAMMTRDMELIRQNFVVDQSPQDRRIGAGGNTGSG